MKRLTFSTAAELADHAAAFILRTASAAICARGRFLLALSGGTTPQMTYDRLARCSVAAKLAWERIHVIWSDERCVPPGDPDSNQGTARSLFLDHVPLPLENVHPIPCSCSPIDAADAYEATLRTLLGPAGRIDLALLGLGADGHIASLFPQHPALQERTRWVLPVHAEATPAWRITMTLPLLLNARKLLFLITGEAKRRAVASWLAGDDTPAAPILAAESRVIVLLDRSADPET